MEPGRNETLIRSQTKWRMTSTTWGKLASISLDKKLAMILITFFVSVCQEIISYVCINTIARCMEGFHIMGSTQVVLFGAVAARQ